MNLRLSRHETIYNWRLNLFITRGEFLIGKTRLESAPPYRLLQLTSPRLGHSLPVSIRVWPLHWVPNDPLSSNKLTRRRRPNLSIGRGPVQRPNLRRRQDLPPSPASVSLIGGKSPTYRRHNRPHRRQRYRGVDFKSVIGWLVISRCHIYIFFFC